MKKLLLVLILFATTTIYAQSYNQGFRDGWLNVNNGIGVPSVPVPKIGRTTYKDGFADGAAAGAKAGNSGSNRSNMKADDWAKVYGAGNSSNQPNKKEQGQVTNVSVKTTNIELAEKREASLEITKPISFDLESVKGFVLIQTVHHTLFNSQYRGWIRKEFEMTPFDVPKKWKKKDGFKEGYIYISVTAKKPDNNNFTSSWIFRDHNRRTVLSVNAVNKYYNEVLGELGITTF